MTPGIEKGKSRKDMILGILPGDVKINVVSGTEMPHRIKKLAPGAGIAEIATLYNNINATKVSDYGARVAQIYKDKPWEYLTKAAERKGGD